MSQPESSVSPRAARSASRDLASRDSASREPPRPLLNPPRTLLNPPRPLLNPPPLPDPLRSLVNGAGLTCYGNGLKNIEPLLNAGVAGYGNGLNIIEPRLRVVAGKRPQRLLFNPTTAPYFDNFARSNNVDDKLYGNHYVAGPALHFDNFARGNVDDVDGELDGNGVTGNFGNHFGNHNDASVAGNFGNFARGNVDDDADELDGN